MSKTRAILFAFGFLAPPAVQAFAAWDVNPANWNEGERFFVALFSLFFGPWMASFPGLDR